MNQLTNQLTDNNITDTMEKQKKTKATRNGEPPIVVRLEPRVIYPFLRCADIILNGLNSLRIPYVEFRSTEIKGRPQIRISIKVNPSANVCYWSTREIDLVNPNRKVEGFKKLVRLSELRYTLERDASRAAVPATIYLYIDSKYIIVSKHSGRFKTRIPQVSEKQVIVRYKLK